MARMNKFAKYNSLNNSSFINNGTYSLSTHDHEIENIWSGNYVSPLNVDSPTKKKRNTSEASSIGYFSNGSSSPQSPSENKFNFDPLSSNYCDKVKIPPKDPWEKNGESLNHSNGSRSLKSQTDYSLMFISQMFDLPQSTSNYSQFSSSSSFQYSPLSSAEVTDFNDTRCK
jgi:hypothetical protein